MINQQGDVDIVNHKTKDVCTVRYHEAPGFFSKEKPNKVTAIIRDEKEQARYLIQGYYNDNVECSEIINPRKINSFEETNMLDLGTSNLLWKRILPEYKTHF